MDSGNNVKSDTSSDENDQPEKSNEEKTCTARFYDSTFCKRGFTNAQALGGHMNMHWKVKAKAKKNNQQSSFLNKSKEDYFSTISMEQSQYHPSLGEHQESNPRYSSPHPYSQSDSTLSVSKNISFHEEHLDSNLSLRIGSSRVEDRKGKEKYGRDDGIENEVDLELRLGHDP